MTHDTAVTEHASPTPEERAGQELRRLRLARGWSQEQAARLMDAYGYDFHQTMIAKIEAAQRPLRVNELADFADLYGVPAAELLGPPLAPEQAAERAARREVAWREREAADAAARRDEARARLDAAMAALPPERRARVERMKAHVDEQLAQMPGFVFAGR